VASTFPQGVVLVNSTVATSGGFFEAITNGACVNPLQFTVTDTAGKTTSATLINQAGKDPAPGPVTLAINPPSVPSNACAGKTFRFIVTGGSPSYNVQVSPTGPVAKPSIVSSSGGFTDISGPFPVGITTITIVDIGSPQQVVSATITCT